MALPERLQSDTSRSYAALCDYAAMGAGRSIDKLLHIYHSSVTENPPTKQRGTLGLWSGKHAWVARCAELDQRTAAQEDADRAAIRRQRRAELEQADWESGSALRSAVQSLIAEIPRFLKRSVSRVEQGGQTIEVITLALAAGPGELARAMKLASDLQRMSVGEPTEHIRQDHVGEIALRPVDYRTGLDALKPEELTDADA